MNVLQSHQKTSKEFCCFDLNEQFLEILVLYHVHYFENRQGIFKYINQTVEKAYLKIQGNFRLEIQSSIIIQLQFAQYFEKVYSAYHEAYF